MKKRGYALAALAALTAAWLVVRFALLSWHHMKDFPTLLFLAGAAVILVFGLLLGWRAAPLAAAAGYVLGFLGGQLFAVDSYDPGGGRMSNGWWIWTLVFLAAIAVGILLDCLQRRKHNG